MLHTIAIASATDSPHIEGEIAREFPTIEITFAHDAAAHVAASDWDRRDFDSWRFDTRLDELARKPFTLCIAGDRDGFPIEVLNRCQRLIGRRNRYSRTTLFDAVLREHRKRHDLRKPLVRADYNHALDVWQWTLRLEPDASAELQLAGLLHDIERLRSEPDRRVEHLADDYRQFKLAHARAGAAMARCLLIDCGFCETIADRVAQLVAQHEQPSTDDEEVALLNDADGLSFFSLNSSGYADYFGPDRTAKKVHYTWSRMRPAARAKLSSVRLRDDVAELVRSLPSSLDGGT